MDYVQKLVDLGYEISIRPDWVLTGQFYIGISKPSKRVEGFAAGKEKINKLAKKVFEKVV